MSFPDRNVAASAYKRCPSWAGYRALPSSPFETLALSNAAELVGVARPRCGGSVTRESDISNGENGDISIGDLQYVVRGIALMEPIRDNDCAPRPLADHASAIIPSSVAVSKEWVNGGGRSWPAKHIVLSSYLDQCGLVTASAMALTRQGFRTKQTSLGTSSWPT